MISQSDELLRAVIRTEQQWRDGAAAIDRQLQRIEQLETTVRELSGIVDELAAALFAMVDNTDGV